MSKTALYALLALTMTALFVLTHYTLNESASEPVGLYRTTGEPISRDRLVLLRNPLKRLVGMPGDTICTTPEGSYINGKLIPNSGIPAGSPYQHYPFGTFKLQPDQYWTLGNHALSYDSRYEGPIPGSLIASTVNPVWTR
ncbi:MAG: S26 family signal peptidase [Deltaproteobacteria bacterium]|nr:S26 family signal peptidase [Deltaproteobacteria bacterium]